MAKFVILTENGPLYYVSPNMIGALREYAKQQGYDSLQDALPQGIEQFLLNAEFCECVIATFKKKSSPLSVPSNLRDDLKEALESYKESKDLLVNEHRRINEKITSFTNDLSWRVEEVNSCIERLNEVRTKIADSLYEQASLSGTKDYDKLIAKWSVEIDSLQEYDDLEFDSPEALVGYELDDPMNVSKYPMPEEE